jgi:transcriptional antiterminator NusG
VSTSSQIVNSVSLSVPFPANDSAVQWYAIRTRSRHEKVASRELQLQGVPVFLPLITSARQWTDRRQQIELPLFSGYAFVKLDYSSSDRVRILRTTGVVGFVGPNPSSASIPDEQIESIRMVLQGKVAVREHPFLQLGQRIRVRSGSLTGVEGILVSVKGSRTLVISVEPIQRSLSIGLDDYEIEPV